MCNISQGIREMSFAEGRVEGEAIGMEKATMEMARTLYEKKMPIEFIAECVKKPIEVVSSWLISKPAKA